MGEFRIDGQGLTLAIVDGYQGDINLQYFCLLSHSALLYHNGKKEKRRRERFDCTLWKF